MGAALRICSLLPSATEIVFALGLGDHLVAVTHECDFPPEAAQRPVVTRSTLGHATGGSREIHHHIVSALHRGSSVYALDQELLARLDPNLFLTQELCDVCAVSYGLVQNAVHRLTGQRTVLSLEPTRLGGILETIEQVGEAAGVPERAGALVAELQRRIDRVAGLTKTAEERPRVFAMEWLDPPFTSGHWMPEMIRLAGGRDELAREGLPSSMLAWERIVEYDPEIVVLMPCGFTAERTIDELPDVELPKAWEDLGAVRSGRIYVVNASAYFSRPGPRIVEGLEILAEIIHPELFPRTMPRAAWQRLGEVGDRRMIGREW
jgi:iron complex transport system substrate-binding protein